jgi:hypothetical protein
MLRFPGRRRIWARRSCGWNGIGSLPRCANGVNGSWLVPTLDTLETQSCMLWLRRCCSPLEKLCEARVRNCQVQSALCVICSALRDLWLSLADLLP